MTRVLLSGGSGFIAAHVIDYLLERGHSVVTTVRSHEKGQRILDAHSNVGKDKLSFVIVEDIAVEHAFDQAVQSDPPFEAVIHTASPFHFNVTDVQKQLLDPAIIGTTGILKSIQKNAPGVKRVVVLSSFASIFNPHNGLWPEHTYTAQDWNPLTHEEALENAGSGYRASKTFAERAAWEFVEKEHPNFSLTTLCPPLVFGPIVHYLNSLDSLNTSNERTRDMLLGKKRDSGLGETGVYTWVDVRDLALCHVLAIERDAAVGQRYLITAGHFCNADLAEIIRKNFPEYQDKLPPPGKTGGTYPEGGVYKYENENVVRDLGIKWRGLDDCVTDLVRSLQAAGA